MIAPACVACASAEAVRPLLYGKPSPAAIKASENDEVILAGCAYSRNSPQWACRTCGSHFWSTAGQATAL